MGKRTTLDKDNEGRDPKRHKSTKDQQVGENGLANITSYSQLNELLTFHQDEAPNKRQSIQAFKLFLEAIAYGDDSVEQSKKKEILLELAKSEAKHDDESDPVYLSGLMQSWSFAAQSNNDGLLSAIPAALALLIKTVSSLLEFREFGIQLCKSLLRRDQLKLINKGLSANDSKEYLISPCLRLLTGIVSFDGGILGKRLYHQQESTFKRLDHFLGMSKPTSVENGVLKQKPSVRLNAVHYFLANLRLQAPLVKSELISQPRLTRSLFQTIRQDMPQLASEILEVCHKHVTADADLSLSIKDRFFNESTLLRITELRDHATSNGVDQNLSMQAQQVLMTICSNVGNDNPAKEGSEKTSDLDASDAFLASTSKGSLHGNGKAQSTLSSFLQHLKPFSNTLDKDLILQAFQASPELVTDYFSKKKSFSYDPKLSATWIGFSAFLYSVIQLPLPESLLLHVPTTPDVVMDHLLPEPLNRKSLERSLNQKHPLIKLLAARLLAKALQKLNVLSSHFKSSKFEANPKPFLSRLCHQLYQRCPEIAVVTAAYKDSCNAESPCLRETLVRLIALYHSTLPQMIRQEKFDISFALANNLSLNQTTRIDGQIGIHHLELDSFLEIARDSLEMRWWYKPKNMSLSSFTTILKQYAESNDLSTKTQEKVREILKSTTRNNYIVSQVFSPNSLARTPLDALVLSLRCFGKSSYSDAIYQFLDNCVCRLARRPIKYESDRYKFNVTADRKPTSLVIVVFAEQWQHFIKNAAMMDFKGTTNWMLLLLKLLLDVGEDQPTIRRVLDCIRDSTTEHTFDMLSQNALQCPISVHEEYRQIVEAYFKALEPKHNAGATLDRAVLQAQRINSQILACKPPEEARDHPELHAWAKKDLEDAIDDGTLGKLIVCLCSTHKEVRLQAVGSMRRFMTTLKDSGYSEWRPVFALFGEIVESADELVKFVPFPSFAGELGARMLQVLADPLHFMYTKVNQFLTKKPRWNWLKLPSQWLVKVILHPPTEQGYRWKEIYWVLQAIYGGLRTSDDMELYRRRNIFERIFSVSTFSAWPQNCDDLVWQIVCRCTFVGGSTTLITDYGILSWIRIRRERKHGERAWLEAIHSQLLRTSDTDKTTGWIHPATANPERIPTARALRVQKSIVP